MPYIFVTIDNKRKIPWQTRGSGIRMEVIMRTNKTNVICKGMIAVAVLACATLFFTGPDAEAKVKYSLKKGTLTVSGKGAMKKAYTGKKKIKKVVIKKGVTSICDEAFFKCKNLKKVKPVGCLSLFRYFLHNDTY